jgi:hypothetical protein
MKEYHMLWAFETGTMMADIQDGLTFFRNKYGVAPTIFYINPQYGLHDRSLGMKVVADKIVTPCHVYIGAE